MPTYLKRYIFKIMGLFLGSFIIFTGCSTVEPSTESMITTVIIKNNTGKYIQKVSISEMTPNGIGRHGSISPVPTGIEQVYGRGDKAKPLPETLRVRLVYNKGKAYEKSISTLSLLSSSSNTHATVVLEFTPNNTIKVYTKTNQ